MLTRRQTKSSSPPDQRCTSKLISRAYSDLTAFLPKVSAFLGQVRFFLVRRCASEDVIAMRKAPKSVNQREMLLREL